MKARNDEEKLPRPIVAGLGVALRARRRESQLSLRELSRRAGVSERFLVQVESGAGNISIARLEDIARVFGARASSLLAAAEDVAGASGVAAVTSAGAAVADAVAGRDGVGRRVVALLGLRGAGKTTIGGRVARALGVGFVELDAEIEARAGMSLRELFEMHGAEFYRRTEREALRALLARGEPVVVATGGGLVTDHESYELLRREAITVWLRARPEDHLARVMAQGDARPMANRADARADLERLLFARRALYERADVTVDTSALGLERAVRAVVRQCRGRS